VDLQVGLEKVDHEEHPRQEAHDPKQDDPGGPVDSSSYSSSVSMEAKTAKRV